MNYVLCPFSTPIPSKQLKGSDMFRAVVEEAAALTSVALFLGMIAIWAQVLGSL
jgi:hypothetical protein